MYVQIRLAPFRVSLHDCIMVVVLFGSYKFITKCLLNKNAISQPSAYKMQKLNHRYTARTEPPLQDHGQRLSKGSKLIPYN